MEPWQVITLIALIVVAILLFGIFLVMAHVIYFSNRLKKRESAMKIIIAEKKEILSSLFDGIRNEGLSVEGIEEEKIDQLRIPLPKKIHLENELSFLREIEAKLTIFLNKNQSFASEHNNKLLIDNHHDLDVNLKRCIANYNYELTGYAYWIKVPILRFVPFLFGYRKKERL